MKRLLFFLLISHLSCKSPHQTPRSYGNLHGNVFWKYNDYVGNKPDGGSSVAVYNTADTSYIGQATCDVRGDFAIDSIPEGYYFVIVNSKSTNESSTDAIKKIYVNKPFLKQITKDSLNGLLRAYNETERYEQLYNGAFTTNEKALPLRQRLAYKDSMNKTSGRWIDSLPATVRYKIGKIFSVSQKVDYEFVSIKPRKTENIVVDFGITYY